MTLEQVINILSASDFHRGEYYEFAEKQDWRCASGATKFCFLIPEADFVIKFCDLDRRRNECEQEARAYENAKKYRVEKALLETRFVCQNKQGIRFFVQPRIDISHDMLSRELRKKLERVSVTVTPKMISKVSNSMYYSGVSRLWIASLISLYGKKFAISFEKWTKENRVNDLHNANIGYLKGKPVLLDYSGYCDF